MGRHLVLVGGGHAHMVTLANLHRFTERGHRVTVVGPSPHHYYSGMGPGMLAGTYAPEEIRFATRRVVEKRGATFVLGAVERVDPAARRLRLASGDDLGYDVVSFNAGSIVDGRVTVAPDAADVFTVKPIETLQTARRRLLSLLARKPLSIAVVGGGAAAVEVAGNLWRLVLDAGGGRTEIALFSGKALLSRFSRQVRDRARRSLAGRGIAVHEGDYVATVGSRRVVTAAGREHHPDVTLLAPGVAPSPIFAASNLPTGPDGGLRVNRFLQCSAYPDIFGGGDCIHFEERPLEKIGVYAVRQNPVLCHNLMAALGEGTPIPFDPGGRTLLIFNMGDGTGVLRKHRFTLGGRLAFLIKDFVDRRFMKRFQALESPMKETKDR
jgi:NADH dehydrogenase FAD-containing subunit